MLLYDQGRIQFLLMSGRSELYQRIELPRLNHGKQGREIFAKWIPAYIRLEREFLTDSNRMGQVRRQIAAKNTQWFSETFYPVDESITILGEDNQRSLTIRNDRPQAGTVHYDKSVKLLIDRRVSTTDKGGITENLLEA